MPHYADIGKSARDLLSGNPKSGSFQFEPKLSFTSTTSTGLTFAVNAIKNSEAVDGTVKVAYSTKAYLAADRGQMITIVSAYSPTEAASDEEAGDFYLRVAALADKANDKRDLLIVAGGSQRRAWDSSQLRRPAVRREFNLQLYDRFGLLEAVPPECADAQAEYDAMAAAIREVATNHLAPRGSRRRRGWQFTLSQRILRLMDARQHAHTAWLRSKSAAAKRERNRANRAAVAALNQLENDVAAFELTRATEVNEAHGRPPDLAETEGCVRALRSAAAPGGDQLDAMLLRCPPAIAWLHRVIIAVWRSGRAPRGWHLSTILKLTFA
ncbi:hypothetical protein FOA52_003762 [Chlamydomonas sp. UWO 241]|nr:hypothetical protein FOA52_003762 [Chlamydomonas sp. UWO 241]